MGKTWSRILEKVNILPTVYGGGFTWEENLINLLCRTELVYGNTKIFPGMRLCLAFAQFYGRTESKCLSLVISNALQRFLTA